MCWGGAFIVISSCREGRLGINQPLHVEQRLLNEGGTVEAENQVGIDHLKFLNTPRQLHVRVLILSSYNIFDMHISNIK